MATPEFVDVDDYTMNMDLHIVKAAIDKNTKTIIPVHLYGFPVDIPKLRKILGKNIPFIEDCPQSHGAKVFASCHTQIDIKMLNNFWRHCEN